MKDRKKYFLREAVVLLIALAMVLSAIPAMTAAETDQPYGGIDEYKAEAPSGLYNVYDTCRPLPRQTPNMQGTPTAWIGYNDGYTENSLGLTSGGDITMAITLTDTELAAYRDYDIQELYVSVGSDVYGFYAANYDVWIEPTLPDYGDVYTGGVNVVYSGTSSGTGWDYIDIPDTAIPATGDVCIGMTFWATAAGVYPCGIDESNTAPAPRANHITYNGFGSWSDLNSIGFPGVWGIDVGVCPGGGPGPSECLPDQCDFELVSINNIKPGPINSLPQIINITIRNNGEVGIPELKLLADVYEKVCGPTSEICCDNVYDLCDWEAEAAADWSWFDDGDGDTFVLQGGPDNRWLTNDQAWRCTAGEDRSFGGDEDVYLGLSPGAVGFDVLEWHCADSNDISGAACAEFTFSHWCEGEYWFDDDENLIPVDYGTLAYSLDGGMTWTFLSFDDFVAYDTEDEWEDVTIKFINTNIFEGTSYAAVCDDCDPEEGDIVIEEAFPAVAKLHVAWIWHKDVCEQYEGWYIDAACLKRTEMYDLILVHQTHDIIELPPCVGAPENIYYEFPLGWDPEPDTWYEICILGQVFDCPDCCEKIFDNNQMCLQFYVTDIHDMACVDIYIDNPKDVYTEGDTMCVNMTVKNMGTFAETNVPVDLKIGKRILDRTRDNDFETDQMGDFDYYYFTGSSPTNYFRWTKGDATIDDIGDGRSVLPGSESVICADPGFFYPNLPNGAGCGMADPNTYDVSDVLEAKLHFYAKWSIPPNEDCDGDGYIDSFWGVLVHPTSGPDSAYWWFAGGVAYFNYQNDWQYMEYDLKAEAESFEYDGTIPDIEYLFGCFMCTSSGNTVPAGNPIPWSGLMLDNIQFDIVTCDDKMEVVDTQYTGALAPGAEEVIHLCWDEVKFCNWCICGDVQLPGDIDTSNDVCCIEGGLQVRDSYDITGFQTWDLTGDDDECLWHICCTRNCDGTCCAWAGIEEEHHGHYVNDMDDSLVSPTIDLEDYGLGGTGLGVSLQITTWYQFADAGDFGEVYVKVGSDWILLRDTTDFKYRISGDSGGFKVMEWYIEAWMCTASNQIRFRMVSDDTGYGEGWYICNVDLVEVTAIGPPPAPGDTWYAFDAYSSGATYDWSVWFDSTIPGDLVPIGPNTASDFWSGGTWADGEWYVSVYGSTGLYTVDPTTGAMNLVGPTSTYFNGLAYDEVNDIMYGVNGYNLYVINRYVGGDVNLGATTAYCIDISFGNGILWGHEFSIDHLVKINPVTLAVTDVGPTGLAANYAQGMEYDKGNDKLYFAAYTTSGALYEVNMATGAAVLIGAFENGAEVDAFAIPYIIADVPLAYGILIWSDDFDRLTIAPWTCVSVPAGNFWDTQTQCISGYPKWGKGLNNAMYTLLDFTDPELTYVELFFTTEWEIEDGCHAYIEISPDWDGVSPMDTATWVAYWDEAGPSVQAPISSRDLVGTGDDRFILDEYLGKTVYLRFRYTTPGEGFAAKPGFWCIHDKQIIFKKEVIIFIDDEAPVTSIFFDSTTSKVTLLAVDYPLLKNCGVKATYYKIDSGSQTTYTAPFTIPEGTHTVYYWSEDKCDPPNVEAQKQKTYTVDTTPPTVEIIVPIEGKIYLFGSPILNRINKETPLCIGKVPMEATADDAGGSGVNKVLFAFNGGTSWDDEAPYTALFKGMKFGDLTITVTAIDNVGLESAPDTMTVKVYCIGLF